MQKKATPAFGTCNLPLALRPIVTLTQNSFLKRGFFRHKLGKLLSAVHTTAVDVAFQRARFRLYPQESNIDLGMLLNPAYNMKEIDFLRANVPPHGIFVDIGANIGLYSILLSEPYGPAALALAVEPNPKVLARLRDNLVLSQATNVLVVEAAVGPDDADMAFHSMDKNLGGSRIADDGELRVPMRKLATIVGENHIEKIDALKIDIEGFEDQAMLPFFKDAPRSLWPRAIVIEQTRKTRWDMSVIDYLGGIGYVRAGGTRSNAFFTLKG